MKTTHKKPKVYIAVLHQGTIGTELAFRLPSVASHEDFYVKTVPYGLKPAAHNRNTICDDFLKSGFDYLVCIDDDVVPPTNILDLVNFDKDVIGAPYPQIKGDGVGFLCMREVKGGYRCVTDKKEGLQELDAVGSGCMVIRRNVLEAIPRPFERRWNEKGLATMGLDFYFCKKAKEKGFTIWTHWGYITDHIKKISLLWLLEYLTTVVEREKNG